MGCEFPSVNSNNDEIKEIFENTKTIAIIGCSPNETKASNMVAKYLKNAGFKIVPVYPKEDEILGEKVYRTLKDIPFKVDMVDIFRKPDVIGLVNNDAANKAEAKGMKVVQNKCTKIEHRNIFT